MKKYSMMIEVDNWNDITSVIEKRAEEVIGVLGRPDSEQILYRVSITCHERQDRWLKEDSSTPMQDQGKIDNILMLVFNGLGPIVGYKKDRSGKWGHGHVQDSNIVEIHVKKTNSGSDKEFIGIEIEADKQ